MARISGVDLPRDTRVEIGLTYLYGIGLSRAQEILAETGVNPDTRVRDLSDEDVAKLRGCIGTYRGRRHRQGLPVRGQRTRTNGRTRRGRKVTVAGKKKAPSKK